LLTADNNMDYGIKAMKVGYSITDTDIRNILMSSKYNMLKYHSDNTTSLSINNGSSSGSVNIAHTLGYVPAYIAYVKSTELSSRNYILPYPGGVYTGTGYDIQVDSYATSSNITLRVNNSTDFGTFEDTATELYDAYWGVNTFILNGRKDGNDRDGAFRFTNVTVAKNATISSANIYCYVQYKGGSTTALKYSIWGIDEDNTASFSGSPMGRTKTTATNSRETSMNISTGTYFGVEVTNQVQEIVNRSGWSSGNAMGFIIEDNGSDNDTWWEDDDELSYLRIVQPGSVSFYFRVIIFKDRVDF
jgi:hypothetical protein